MPKILINLLTFIVLMMAGLYALVRHLEKNAVFFPSRNIAVDPSALGLPWENIYFKTGDDVLLNGWFFKRPGARSTVLFAHGNAGNMSDRLFKVRFFHDLGLNLFMFDYRGYGKSEGKPSEAGIYLDGQGAYDYLKSRGDVDMKNIILYGASLGGTVVIDLAARRNTALLIVESAFSNARDMAHIHYPFLPPFFLNLKFDSLDKVRRLGMPKLFIHSPEDEIVPYGLGQKLFEAAAPPKEAIKIHGGHNHGTFTTDPAAAREFIRVLKARDLA
jgi:fermentation-respiration switch protein FrsA (DUF1100 family)